MDRGMPTLPLILGRQWYLRPEGVVDVLIQPTREGQMSRVKIQYQCWLLQLSQHTNHMVVLSRPR